MLELDVGGLRASLGGTEVLSGVDLAVDAGECVGIVGPNGAGKSTLLNVLTGLVPASAGRVSWRGRDVTTSSIGAQVRAGLVRSFEAGAVWDRLSVLDNVAVGSLRQGPLAEVRGHASRFLEATGVANLAEMDAGSLSLGTARRVELARLLLRVHEITATSSSPPLVLLDEPLRGLDVPSKDRLVSILQSELRGRATILFVEHDHGRAALLADRLVHMEAGRVRAYEPPLIRSECDEDDALDANSGAPLLELRGIRAGYGVTEVLAGVDLDIPTGKGVHLMGPNGCGKSTLLAAIAGVLPGTRGHVTWRGRAVRDRGVSSIVWVPQGGRLIPSLTVDEHLSLTGRGPLGDEFATAVPGVHALSPRPAAALSAGQRALAALWIAFSSSPALLLLDEPTAALTPEARGIVFDFLRRWLSPERAYVLVEHGVDVTGTVRVHMEGGALRERENQPV